MSIAKANQPIQRTGDLPKKSGHEDLTKEEVSRWVK
jgi:hypothetical protein